MYTVNCCMRGWTWQWRVLSRRPVDAVAVVYGARRNARENTKAAARPAINPPRPEAIAQGKPSPSLLGEASEAPCSALVVGLEGAAAVAVGEAATAVARGVAEPATVDVAAVGTASVGVAPGEEVTGAAGVKVGRGLGQLWSTHT
jgi:hypothetical protein